VGVCLRVMDATTSPRTSHMGICTEVWLRTSGSWFWYN